MRLNYELSETNQRLLKLAEDEEIYYALPLDIGKNGAYQENSYAVFTNVHLCILEEGELLLKYALASCEKIKSEPQIACGFLTVVRDGEEEIIGRFSAKHLARFSYAVRGAMLLRQGKRERVVSTEYEHFCPKCKRVLPGTKACPHCQGKGEGIILEIMDMLKPYKWQLTVILALMLSASGLNLLNPEIQKNLIDKVLAGRSGSLGQAFFCLFVMFVLSLCLVAANVAKSYLCAKLGSAVSMDLRKQVYGKIQVLSLSFIQDRRPGELMNRIVGDTRRIRDFMQNVFCNLFTVVITFICMMIYMLILDAKLALLAFLLMPVSLALSVAFRKDIRRRFRRQRMKGDNIYSQLQDVISGMAVVKSYGKEAEEAERFGNSAGEFAAVQIKNEVFWALFYPALSFLMGAGVYLVLFFGGRGVLAGGKTAGELLQFVSYTTALYTYLGFITNLPRELMNLVTSIQRIQDVMSQEPLICDRKNAVDHRIEGEIEFKDVSFGYKSYQPVLEHINLKVLPGEMIGLVGASGTGKSTLINLVMHLYEADDGVILVDGKDIRDIRIECFHSQVGVVLQENFLFSGTILNNLKFARPDASYEEIIRAAKMANAHDFICRMPDGYNTYVGEKGFNLSGGERQRLAIARAILNNPRLLILDEATASLDTESEYLIQKALERLRAGRTTFAIAHRLSTLKDADRLVVIDGHGIAEVGTHNQLMEQKGIYYGLVTAQLEMQKTG